MNDHYARGVLTVIAAALVLLVIQNVVRPAAAGNDVQRVAICDALGTTCANVGIFGLQVFTR
jgi:hypothetical protein